MTPVIIAVMAITAVLVLGTVIEVLRAAWATYENSTRAATRRWRRINAARGQNCQCGKPGTTRHHIPAAHYVGAEAPAYWACAEHADIPLNTPWQDGKPLTGQTRDECCWSHRNPGGLVTACGCGTHIGE